MTYRLAGLYIYIEGIPKVCNACNLLMIFSTAGNFNAHARSMDKTIKVWNTKTSKSIKTFRGHEGGVECIWVEKSVCFSGSYDKTIRCFKIDVSVNIYLDWRLYWYLYRAYRRNLLPQGI